MNQSAAEPHQDPSSSSEESDDSGSGESSRGVQCAPSWGINYTSGPVVHFCFRLIFFCFSLLLSFLFSKHRIDIPSVDYCLLLYNWSRRLYLVILLLFVFLFTACARLVSTCRTEFRKCLGHVVAVSAARWHSDASIFSPIPKQTLKKKQTNQQNKTEMKR